MKIYKNENNEFIMDDNGVITTLTPNKDYYLKLPTNSCNRVWVSCKKVDEAPNQCVDYGNEVKVARVLGSRAEQSKKLLDYATPDERALIDEILAKCKERKAADKPAPKTELEKAERRMQNAINRVKELKAQQLAQKEGD